MESYLGLRSPEGTKSRRDQWGPEGTKGVQKGPRGFRRDKGGPGGNKGAHEGPSAVQGGPSWVQGGLNRFWESRGVQEGLSSL